MGLVSFRVWGGCGGLGLAIRIFAPLPDNGQIGLHPGPLPQGTAFGDGYLNHSPGPDPGTRSIPVSDPGLFLVQVQLHLVIWVCLGTIPSPVQVMVMLLLPISVSVPGRVRGSQVTPQMPKTFIS